MGSNLDTKGKTTLNLGFSTSIKLKKKVVGKTF